MKLSFFGVKSKRAAKPVDVVDTPSQQQKPQHQQHQQPKQCHQGAATSTSETKITVVPPKSATKPQYVASVAPKQAIAPKGNDAHEILDDLPVDISLSSDYTDDSDAESNKDGEAGVSPVAGPHTHV